MRTITSERLAELKQEIAVQCARFAGELGLDGADAAQAHGLCSRDAFLRITEGGHAAIGLARLTDFLFTLRDRVTDAEFGIPEHVEDEPMEDGPCEDGIPY